MQAHDLRSSFIINSIYYYLFYVRREAWKADLQTAWCLHMFATTIFVTSIWWDLMNKTLIEAERNYFTQNGLAHQLQYKRQCMIVYPMAPSSGRIVVQLSCRVSNVETAWSPRKNRIQTSSRVCAWLVFTSQFITPSFPIYPVKKKSLKVNLDTLYVSVWAPAETAAGCVLEALLACTSWIWQPPNL